MPQTVIKEQIYALLLPLATSLQLDIWGVEVALGPRGIVRIYVVKKDEDSVDIESCAELSRLLSLSLDVADYIEGMYTLEISSPGLERIFFTEEQLKRAVGEKVEVLLFKATPFFIKRKKFRGTLISFTDGIFSLLLEENIADEELCITFAFTDVRRVRRIYEFTSNKPVRKLSVQKKDKKSNAKSRKLDDTPKASQTALVE